MKPANILVDLTCRVQIIDFGLSRHAGATADGPADGDATDQPLCLTPFPTMKSRRLGSSAASPLSRVRATAAPVGAPVPIQQTPLSQHVATRWYRAPEVLLQSQYNSSADMWGLGCIWAELLQTLQGPGAEPSPLFPGASSQLSVNRKIRHTKGGLSPKLQPPAPQPDKQLVSILGVIGAPSEEEFDTVICSRTEPQVVVVEPQLHSNHNNLAAFRTELGLKHGQPSVSKLPKLFAFAPADAQQLLSALLAFDPAKRWTTADALAMPFLLMEDKWWCADNEAVSLQQLDDGKMEFEFETDGSTALRSALRQRLDAEIGSWNSKHVSGGCGGGGGE
jgi:serine/threonine protein kinase